MWCWVALAVAGAVDDAALVTELVALDDAALVTRLAELVGEHSGDPAMVARLSEGLSIARGLPDADLPPMAREAVIEAMISNKAEEREWARSQLADTAAPAPTSSDPVSADLLESYDNRRLVLGPIRRSQTTVQGDWVVMSSWQDWTVYEGGYRALDGLQTAEILGDQQMEQTIRRADRVWTGSGVASLVAGGISTLVGVVLIDQAISDLDTGPTFYTGTALAAGGAGAITFGAIATLSPSFKHRFPSFAWKKNQDDLRDRVEVYNAELRSDLGLTAADVARGAP